MTTLEDFRAAPLHHVDLGSCHVAYRRFGAGPDLVLVHGWPLSGETFRDIVAALRHDFTCFVPDLPGAGHTPWDDTLDEAFTGYADRMVAFVDALELSHFGLFGHDSGGAVARIVASKIPSRVFGLGLTNTEVPDHVPLIGRILQGTAKLPGSAAMLKPALRFRPFLRSSLGFGSCFKNLDFIDGAFAATALAAAREDPARALTILRRADLSWAHRCAEVHAAIEAPLVAVWGDDDPFFPYSGAQRMVDAWPVRAELHRLSGYRLFVHEEAPDEVTRIVGPFLLDAARPPSASPG